MKKIVVLFLIILVITGCQKEEKIVTITDCFSEAEIDVLNRHENQTPIKMAYFEKDKGQTTVYDSDLVANIYSLIFKIELGDKVDKYSDELLREYDFIYENGESLVFLFSKTKDTVTIYNAQDSSEYEVKDDKGLFTMYIDFNTPFSFEDAIDFLNNYDEVVNYLEKGMEFMDGGTEMIGNVNARIVNLGTNSSDKFTTEQQYAVLNTWEVKCFDVATNSWIDMAMAG